MTKPSEHPLEETFTSYQRVSSYELDSHGHVNNAVFLNYLERARGDYLLSKDLRFSDFKRWDRFPIVIRANLEYKAPAFADDEIVVKGRIAEVTAASFTMDYQVYNIENNRLLLTGQTVHVFVNKDNRPSRIPEEFSKKFIAPSTPESV